MKQRILIVLLLFFSFSASAQLRNNIQTDVDLGIDIDSILVRTRLNKDQINTLFGTDTVRYYEGLTDDAYLPNNAVDSTCLFQKYEFEHFSLYFEENGVLTGFSITDNSHRAMVRRIPGGLTVGDPISKLTSANLPGFTIRRTPSKFNPAEYKYEVWLNNADYVLNIYVHDDNTIKTFVYLEY